MAVHLRRETEPFVIGSSGGLFSCSYFNTVFSYVTKLTIPVQLLRTSLQGSIVVLLVIGLPVVVINVLLPSASGKRAEEKGTGKSEPMS